MQPKIKIWLGIGSYLLVGACPLTVAVAGEAEQSTADAGEAGESGPVMGSDPDQAFMTNLLLMKGHLHSGKQLADHGIWNHAGAHVMHPAAENYEAVRGDLAVRKIPDFEGKLDTLAIAVVEKQSSQIIEAAYAEALDAINRAIRAVAETKRVSPGFMGQLLQGLLRYAGDEYAVGVKQGKISDLHEYQDAMGFAWVADELIGGLPPEARLRHAAVYDAIRLELAAVKAAWDVGASKGDAATPAADVLSAVSRIELKLGKLK